MCALADQRGLSVAALAGDDIRLTPAATPLGSPPHQPLDAAAHEYRLPRAIKAKLAIADDLAQPLAKLSSQNPLFVEQVLKPAQRRSEVRQWYLYEAGNHVD